MIRMGYVRLNFSYFMHQNDIDYVLNAIEFVSKYGWMYLPDYTFDKEFAEFYARVDTDHQERNWLGEIDYSEGVINYKNSNAFINNSDVKNYDKIFDEAKDTLVKVMKNYHHIYGKSKLDQREIIDEDFRHLVFFIYPSEIIQELDKIVKTSKDLKFDDLEQFIKVESEYTDMPFIPLSYNNSSSKVKDKVEESSKEVEEQTEDDAWDDDVLPGMGLIDEINNDKQDHDEILPIVEPPKEIMKLVGEAIKDFDMIRENDGILIALSGGKDSLSLLNILRYLQKKAPVKFKLGAITIDPKTVEYDPSPLKGYLKKLGIPYFYEADNLIERAETSMENNSICSF